MLISGDVERVRVLLGIRRRDLVEIHRFIMRIVACDQIMMKYTCINATNLLRYIL